MRRVVLIAASNGASVRSIYRVQRDHAAQLAREVAAAVALVEEREREIVSTLMRAAEHRDADTGDHIARVSAYVGLIAEAMGLSPAERRALALAATMHDVGKIAVPDSILLKPSLMRALARRQRRRCGRRATPRLAIIDTQSVKCLGVRGPRGYDGAKKLVGRKRVALVEAEGHWLAVAVVPANVQDRDTLTALDDGKEQWPSLRLAILDGAFTGERCREWCHRHGMRHRVVEKEPDQKGFVVLERRWLVERTFGWLSHWGGLLCERAGRLDVATGRLACVACLMAVTALAPRWPMRRRISRARTVDDRNPNETLMRSAPLPARTLMWSGASMGRGLLKPARTQDT